MSLWQVKSALANSYVAHTWGKFTRNKARQIFSSEIWTKSVEKEFCKTSMIEREFKKQNSLDFKFPC